MFFKNKKMMFCRFALLFMFFISAFSLAEEKEKAPLNQEVEAALKDPTTREKLLEVLQEEKPKAQENQAEEVLEHIDEAVNSDPEDLLEDAQEKSEEKTEEIALLETERVTENTRHFLRQMVNFPHELAQYTANIALQMEDTLAKNWQTLRSLTDGRDYHLRHVDWGNFTSALLNLAKVFFSLLIIYHGIRFLFTKWRIRLNDWVLAVKPVLYRRKFGALLLCFLGDGIALCLAYFLGNIVAIYAVGETGALSAQASFLINAFFIIEILKIILRVFFVPRFLGLRLFQGSQREARYWYYFLANLLHVLGYGYLVVLPLIKVYISEALSQVLASALTILCFIYALSFIIYKRRRITLFFKKVARSSPDRLSRLFALLAGRLWFSLALIYFFSLLFLTLIQGEKALPFFLKASLLTVVVLFFGILLSRFIRHFIYTPFKFSDEFTEIFPGVASILNRQLPLILKILHAICILLVFAFILDAWHIVDLKSWAKSASGSRLLDRWIGAFLVLAFAFVLWIVITAYIEHRLSPNTGRGAVSAREQTLLAIIKNALGIFFVSISTMMVLSQIGINIGPLIAGAGVIGLAVGFGAQTLVKDVITGIFIQIENAMNRGDSVTVSGITGTVERISIRSVGLRDSSGTYHVVPFSNVGTVSNHMRDYAYFITDYNVAYQCDIERAYQALQEAYQNLLESAQNVNVLGVLEIQGVSALSDGTSMAIRVRIKTRANSSAGVGRAFNRLVKESFDKEKIELPSTQQNIYFVNELRLDK